MPFWRSSSAVGCWSRGTGHTREEWLRGPSELPRVARDELGRRCRPMPGDALDVGRPAIVAVLGMETCHGREVLEYVRGEPAATKRFLPRLE